MHKMFHMDHLYKDRKITYKISEKWNNRIWEHRHLHSGFVMKKIER